ncbi:hypothetical protein [Petroclostridium sp. X23]|uniref:hypothetical protein n=1 Tax=Petroclostridium sp. X23 TaxID=3045146 RepID=UPI0024AE0694|nr:hypothetical protein [Petroclostridium sp. X23]WHH59028.1 hypothetical protein QKW49_25110 [Petroclostridium sp. X23]
MYDKVYERVLRSMTPFHNKVLRFNYDLPLEHLGKALKTVMIKIEKCFCSQVVYKAQDRLEYDGRAVREHEEIKLSDLYAIFEDEQRLYLLGNEYEWMKVGLFGEELDWYLRIFIEDDNNLGESELRTGNMEIYVCDEVMQLILKDVEGLQMGHILLEGAKKYIEEIYI